MLRIFLGLILLSACSMGTVKNGGEERYFYDVRSDYTQEDLKELAPKVVTSLKREPRVGKLDKLFGKNQKPIKRVGVVVFESIIQPTIGGLAGEDKIYISNSGKQLFTEGLLRIWEQSFPILGSGVDYVPTSKIKRARAFNQYGLDGDDYVQSKRNALEPDDIFFLEKGKSTSMKLTFNPRGMRDVSFMLVPAYELMAGPKWSEHNKHFVNDLMKELKLDAVIIVMSKISWTSAHKDRFSDDYIPEEIEIKINASTLLSLSEYNERLAKSGIKETADVTLCYRAYESAVKIPTNISVPEMDQNFSTITKEVINPTLKTYKDLSQMTVDRIVEDLKKTW